MHKDTVELAAAAIITLVGFLLGLSIVLAVKGFGGVFAVSGVFLFASFSYAAFYVPLFLFAGAFLLLSPRFGLRHLVALCGTVPLFFTAGLLLRLLFFSASAPALRFFRDIFTPNGASFLVFTLLALEIVILVRFWTLLFGLSPTVGRSTRTFFSFGEDASSLKGPSSVTKARAEADASLSAHPGNDTSGHTYEGEIALPTVLRDREAAQSGIIPNAPDLPPLGSLGYGQPDGDALEQPVQSRPTTQDAPPFSEEESDEVVSGGRVEGVENDVDDDVDEDVDIELPQPDPDRVPDPVFPDPSRVEQEPEPGPETIDNDETEEVEAIDPATGADETNKVEAVDLSEERLRAEASRESGQIETRSTEEDLATDGSDRVDPVEDLDELEVIDDWSYVEEDDEEDLLVDLEDDEAAEEDEAQATDLSPVSTQAALGRHGQDDDSAPRNSEAPTPKSVSPARKPRKSYSVPTDGLLDEYPDGQYWVVDEETKKSAEVLRQTLEEFKITAEVTGIRKGPVITMFEILPSPGVKLSKIVNLADNIALRLAASRVRIVAPIPGKHAVGIEVPNKERAIVSFREMLEDGAFKKGKMAIPVILGKDITGDAQIVDLAQTPHLLIAGATGSGKSVCVNSLILSILYKRHPEEVKLMLIDPKIVELKLYNDIPHLLTPVITESKRAFQALQYCLCEMERRYSLLDSLAVRDIKSYNRKIKEKRLATTPLPYIVVVVDEFADLMASSGKELESTLARLAAMSRAVGLHLVLATQRPSIDVITGLIKANIPSRIAFMVAGKFDSRIIIDSVGAEKLLGKGDMLFTSAWDPHPTRIQGSFVSPDEVERVVEHVKTFGEPDYIDDEIFIDEEDDEYSNYSAGSEDPLMGKALEIISSTGKASASFLQRRLKIGYNRAARLVEEMEMRGIVGPQNGSKPREVLHIPDTVSE